MRYDHKQYEMEDILPIEIRIPVQKEGQDKCPAKLFGEAAQALKNQCNLKKDRPRLLNCENENGVLVLKYEILRKPEKTN